MGFYSVVGAVAVAGFVYKLLSSLWIAVYPHLLAKRLGHLIDLKSLGQWAVVTGATDGIGKGYAKQLAKRGLNVVLISRNAEKLQAVAEEIHAFAPNIETKTLAIDFTTADAQVYEKTITDALKDIEIGVLVNNVGMSYPFPEQVLKIRNGGHEYLQNMVYVNCLSALQMIKVVMPSMVARGKGAVVNISSATAMNPSPYLTVYSACKIFVDYLSRGLRSEYADSGVIVQVVHPFYVSTKMSGMRRKSFFIADPDEFAASALNTVGVVDITSGCFSHELQSILVGAVPSFLVTVMMKRAMMDTRGKFLRKEQKQQQQEQKKEE